MTAFSNSATLSTWFGDLLTVVSAYGSPVHKGCRYIECVIFPSRLDYGN